MRQSLWKKTCEHVGVLLRPLRGELLETRCLLSSTPDLLPLDTPASADFFAATTLPLIAPPIPAEPAPILSPAAGPGVIEVAEAPPPAGVPGDAATDSGPAASAPSTALTATTPASPAAAESSPATEEYARVPSENKPDADPAQTSLMSAPTGQVGSATVADEAPGEQSSQDRTGATGLDRLRLGQATAHARHSGDSGDPATSSDNPAARCDLAAAATAPAGAAAAIVLASASPEQTEAPASQPIQSSADEDQVRDDLFTALALEIGIAGDQHEDDGNSGQAAAWSHPFGAATRSSSRTGLLAAVSDWRRLERLSLFMGQFQAETAAEPDSARPIAAAGLFLFAGPRGVAVASGPAGAAGRPEEPASATSANRAAKVRSRYAIHAAHDQILAAVDDEQLAGFVQLVDQELAEARLAIPDGPPSPPEAVEAEMARLKEQLARQERLAVVGQAVAGIAHDLRNPLAVVRSAAWLLKRCLPAGDPKPQSYLEAIDAEIETANRIISNLMEIVRAKEAVKESVDFGATARQVFEKLQNRADISCRIDCQPEPFTVHADPTQLRQVLGNLMSNAAEAMGATGEIRLEARRADGFDLLTIRDSGPGIPPEIRQTLFEPLVSTRLKGTGLGLAICRQIVDRHGGTIDLLPSDAGAAFQIRLPHSPQPV
ncbi:MAG: GHKL domain-containing protein [Thermoguttaceae bacterium]|nr:GHKL domain-containing protein [Thermoguttaceae bacterium]